MQSLWWDGSFSFEERVLTSRQEVDAYLAGPVDARGGPRRGWSLRRRLARWVSGA